MSGFVTISGVSKSYKKGVPVLLPLDLEIRKGEIFFLLGPSGCGKSTLLRIIAGLLEPTEGKILLDGEDITNGLRKNGSVPWSSRTMRSGPT